MILAVKLHAYDYGAKGVTLLLEAVQRVGDGEPILQDPNERGSRNVRRWRRQGLRARGAARPRPPGVGGTYSGLFGKSAG